MRILPSFASASFSSCAPGYAIPALRPDMCSCWKRYASHSSTNSATASNTRRNTRRSLNSGEDNSATPLTLEHFVIKTKVLALYRSFCRNTKGSGALSARQETVQWIRSEFELHRKERDLPKIKALLANGKRQLKQLSNSGMLVGQDGDKFRGKRAL